MQHYKMDLAHYFSVPGLAWDAMLKMSGVELDFMVERVFHDIIDKGPEAASAASVGSLRGQTTSTSKITMQSCRQNA